VGRLFVWELQEAGLELLQEGSTHFLLVLEVQLGSGTGNVKYIGCGLALGVNDRDLNVAAEFGHG
jgi:hypothetical protein